MLPANPISAVDAINPAIEWTKRAMLRPFSWAKWWRVGLLGLAVGEFSTFSCNFNVGDFSHIGQRQQHFQAGTAAVNPFPPEVIASIMGTLIIGIFVLVLVHMYVASVLRFAYFDAVATGRYRLREGWARWHSRGLRWFGFSLVLMILSGVVLAAIILPAVFLGAGIYKALGGAGIALLLLIGLPLALLLLFSVAAMYVLIKDFAVPMVALEHLSVFDAVKRVLSRAWQRKGEHAGYIGMKVVIAIAFGVAAAIVQFVLMLIVLIPIIGAVIAGGALGVAKGGNFDPQTLINNAPLIALIVLGFVLVVFLILSIAAIILAPGLFFFEAYVLTWFAQRYEPLWNLLYPPAPAAAPTPIIDPIAPLEPPPLPAV